MGNLLFSIFPNERFMDLTLYQYGYEACDPLHSFGPFVRNHYLFHYVISGQGTLSAGEDYHVGPAMGFLITPGEVTTYYADQNDPWEYVWVEFDGLKASQTLELAGLTRNSPIYQSISAEGAEAVKNEMLYLAQQTGDSPFRLMGHLYFLLDALITSSVSRNRLQQGKLSDFYVREALSFIENNYMREITVADLARSCNLNRSYFGKIFRDAMKKSPQEFLAEYRMEKAARMLTTTDISIGEISASVGYPNQLHFSRAFKRVYSMAPRDYRKKFSAASHT